MRLLADVACWEIYIEFMSNMVHIWLIIIYISSSYVYHFDGQLWEKNILADSTTVGVSPTSSTINNDNATRSNSFRW